MKPIIKWSGGKAKELKEFKHYFPEFKGKYIEPFAGGAAVFFNLEKPSIINDINYELISLYKILQNEKDRETLIYILNFLNNRRKDISNFVNELSNTKLKTILNNSKIRETPFICSSFGDDENKLLLLSEINKSITDKLIRIKRIEDKENKEFSFEEMKQHLETAMQSALYFYCRKIYNEKKNINSKLPWYIAHWVFVREFCYSSMFRFSKSGNFNVPYGGISYNTKDLKNKIDRFSDNTLIDLLKSTDVNNLDFEELFKKYDYFNKNDFIFLDPPYDTEFSQYNKEKDFDKEDQIRLRDNLLKVKAKFMIVIKETDFISELYKDFNVFKFDKKYQTNMRNRNNQDVVHLIITNYEI